MAWIEDNGIHINLDLVRTFYWQREDTFHANLYLQYENGEVIIIKDPYQVKYCKVCAITGQKASERR